MKDPTTPTIGSCPCGIISHSSPPGSVSLLPPLFLGGPEKEMNQGTEIWVCTASLLCGFGAPALMGRLEMCIRAWLVWEVLPTTLTLTAPPMRCGLQLEVGCEVIGAFDPRLERNERTHHELDPLGPCGNYAPA